jgi:hypothetical protein
LRLPPDHGRTAASTNVLSTVCGSTKHIGGSGLLLERSLKSSVRRAVRQHGDGGQVGERSYQFRFFAANGFVARFSLQGPLSLAKPRIDTESMHGAGRVNVGAPPWTRCFAASLPLWPLFSRLSRLSVPAQVATTQIKLTGTQVEGFIAAQ